MNTLSHSPRRRSLCGLCFGFLSHHNPFYLISALCMIAGCYALNSALELRAGQIHRLLILIATLNAYEVLLVLLGIYLIRRRGMQRDGTTLLLLELVFLADLTFLNAELATSSWPAGTWLNLGLFVLALAKVAAILRALAPRFPARLFCTVAAMLAGLFLVPCLLKAMEHGGWVWAGHFYSAWVLVGALPALHELQRYLWPMSQADQSTQLRPPIARLYVAVPFVSLLAHMAMIHWVYRAPFYGADLSPVLLGLALASASLQPSARISKSDLQLLRAALPAVALLLSRAYPPQWVLSVPGSRLTLTPFTCTAAAAYAIYIYLFFRPHARYWLGAGCALFVASIFAPTPSQIAAFAGRAFTWVTDQLSKLVPKTAIQWGVTAVVAAFAFLSIGAVLSLSRKTSIEGEPPAPDLE